MEIDELVAAAQAGDREALQGIGRWLALKLGTHFGRSFERHDADDLRQQCCEVIVRDFSKFESEGPGSFVRWVRKIASLETRARKRAYAREADNLAKLANLPLPSTLSPTSKLSLIEIQALVVECFARLSEFDREVILWGLDDERDDRELAELYDITVNAIRTRRHRAREKLIELVQIARRSPARRARQENSPSS